MIKLRLLPRPLPKPFLAEHNPRRDSHQTRWGGDRLGYPLSRGYTGTFTYWDSSEEILAKRSSIAKTSKGWQWDQALRGGKDQGFQKVMQNSCDGVLAKRWTWRLVYLLSRKYAGTFIHQKMSWWRDQGSRRCQRTRTSKRSRLTRAMKNSCDEVCAEKIKYGGEIKIKVCKKRWRIPE